ncbi:CrcB family protein [Prochlorococcus marinus XMU1419]|uniref:fluoride efflux transporter FluC n=1 Tax=Prochlorococcus marinus TaxID=1219 RepID=UPI001ADC4538|nr:CrcB family protein [Prochlorococcus marinus]MBO8234631.1 CrcB family protein [Prochlorococcus marinus XMU1419]MBW3076302.1 chromosome condensation protein CrcB [Prochlorococcus marinus str. XMU1419]
MDFHSIRIVFLGSTLGLILRIIIQNNLKINLGFDIQNISVVNFIGSFFLGIFVALNFSNNNLLMLFYAGFLGSFSTFSSFIYQLFILFQKRKFLSLFFHYLEVMFIAFILFYLGYFLVKFLLM